MELIDLPHKILKEAQKVGIRKENLSGSYFHFDQETIFSKVNEHFQGKLEMLDILEALKDPEVAELKGSLIKEDEYTKEAQNFSGGYFIRVKKGETITFPLQTCLLMAERKEQRVHNLIILEEGAEAHIITGCIANEKMAFSSHIGISEFFIGKNAKLYFTMLHHFSENAEVFPRSAALIDEGGVFVSNYINLYPVKHLQMNPKAICRKNAKAVFQSVTYSNQNTKLDLGSQIFLEGEKSRGEILSRSVVKDSAEVIQRGQIFGHAENVKGHLECQGLMLNDGASLFALPELYGNKESIDLSHEAAIGKIAEKEIEYLMTRGLSREKATSLIIKGFLALDFYGLSDEIKQQIAFLISKTAMM